MSASFNFFSLFPRAVSPQISIVSKYMSVIVLIYYMPT